MTLSIPRLMLAAPASGSGKTTVTCALLQALREKGSRRTPEEEKQYKMLTEGGSCVAFENLGGLRRWLREQI